MLFKMGWNFLKVIIEKQTYLNLLYLLIAFPLGLFYFTFLVTGVSLGLGLIITLFGIPLLILMSFLWYWMAIFERQLSSLMLDIDVKPIQNKLFKQKTFLKKVLKHLSEPITWKSFIYLLIKFPLGLLSFVLLITLLSVSLSLVLSPLIYYLTLNIPNLEFMTINGVQLITQGWQIFLLTILGLILLFVSLHILNGLAYVSGLIVQVLLGKSQKEPKKKKV